MDAYAPFHIPFQANVQCMPRTYTMDAHAQPMDTQACPVDRTLLHGRPAHASRAGSVPGGPGTAGWRSPRAVASF